MGVGDRKREANIAFLFLFLAVKISPYIYIYRKNEHYIYIGLILCWGNLRYFQIPSDTTKLMYVFALKKTNITRTLPNITEH